MPGSSPPVLDSPFTDDVEDPDVVVVQELALLDGRDDAIAVGILGHVQALPAAGHGHCLALGEERVEDGVVAVEDVGAAPQRRIVDQVGVRSCARRVANGSIRFAGDPVDLERHRRVCDE